MSDQRLWDIAEELDASYPPDTGNDAALMARLALRERRLRETAECEVDAVIRAQQAEATVDALRELARRHGLCLDSGLPVRDGVCDVCDCEAAFEQSANRRAGQ